MTMQTSATPYGAGFPGHEPADIPPHRWRQIKLTYPGDRVITLAYEHAPSDPSELPELMWQLQRAARHRGYKITVILTDGTRVDAPAISTKANTPGNQP